MNKGKFPRNAKTQMINKKTKWKIEMKRKIYVKKGEKLNKKNKMLEQRNDEIKEEEKGGKIGEIFSPFSHIEAEQKEKEVGGEEFWGKGEEKLENILSFFFFISCRS